MVFKPHLNMFIDFWGAPHQHKKESFHKTDYQNVLSDF